MARLGSLSASDGRIVLPNGAILSPRMSRRAFEAELPNASVLEEGSGWATYDLGPNLIEGRAFCVEANFEKEALRFVWLANKEMADAGWSGFSEELATRLNEENQAWLTQILGQSRRFLWGTIEAGYDVKTGVPQIVVHYN